MPHVILVFASPAAASFRVAGVPAAARAARALAVLRTTDPVASCTIVAPGGGAWGHDVAAECARLAPGLPLAFAAAMPARNRDTLVLAGEAFVAAVARGQADARAAILPALFDTAMERAVPARESAALAVLARAGHAIVARTGKCGDGIVSRHLNRPISQAISRALLRLPGIRPHHASFATAAIALVMTLALLLGGQVGLVVGALLFQAASIVDGVDGEMARATWRTSARGATLDSVIDAGTNLAFVTGVAVNVGLAGDLSGAFAGGLALAILATGLLLIGRRAETRGEPVNFDIVKVHLRARGRRSAVTEWLIFLTMRDFFAFACAALIVLGQAHWTLIAFATVAAGWLAVTLGVLARTATPVAALIRATR